MNLAERIWSNESAYVDGPISSPSLAGKSLGESSQQWDSSLRESNLHSIFPRTTQTELVSFESFGMGFQPLAKRS